MYSFIEGPLVSISFAIFILGLFYQVIQFFKLTRKKRRILPRSPGMERQKNPLRQSIFERFNFTRGTFWQTDPLMMIMTSLFHGCLILTPVFLLGHNILLDQSWGIRIWSVPESLTDVLTIVLLICAVYFITRRIFLARVRAITSFYDYFVLLVAVVPFFTGLLAYHQFFDYRIVMLLHILSGELMLITMPFTKLGHMLFFFLYRFFIAGEYSFTRGSRTW